MKIESLPCDVFEPKTLSGHAVVVLHGRGDSSAGFHWMPEVMRLPGVRWILPNAPDPWGEGFSWYDMAPHQEPGVVRSRALLDALFDELESKGQAPEKTVLFGFSQGCLLTLEWGARTPRPLAGCIGISGYCYDVEAIVAEHAPEATQRPFFVSHGTLDEVLPYERTVRQMTVLKEAGLNVDFRGYEKTHTIGPDLRDIHSALVTMLGLAG